MIIQLHHASELFEINKSYAKHMLFDFESYCMRVCLCVFKGEMRRQVMEKSCAESNEFANLCELATLLAPFLTPLS